MNNEAETFLHKRRDDPGDQRLFVRITMVIQAILVVGLMLFVVRRDWENVFLSLIVIALILVPTFFLKQYKIKVPPDIQLVAVGFVFLSLFLGSARDFYYRFWWWDLALHLCSGFLMGIVGWITLFLLNETNRVPKGMQPAFLCFFAVTFASFLGILWEIMEYTVDSISPSINMQSNETGVADTMTDLILNLIGATAVAAMGWVYMKKGQFSFVVDLVRRFIRKNPRLFRKD